jgi:hypothetical protein
MLEEFRQECRELCRKPSKFGRLRWRDLDKPGPEHEYIIDGFLSVGDKSIIGGPSMSGKSFLAIHAGMSIALATIRPDWEFFGMPVLKPGLVVYQAGEGARGVKKRLRLFRKHFNVPSDIDLPFELLMSPVDLYNPNGDTKALIDEINAIREDYPDLPLVSVFIDTLATATGGADENSGKDMGAVMKNVDALRSATGANITLVHHLNAAGTKLRGHTSILANIDQVLMVTSDETTKIRTVRLGKQKDDDDSLTLRFELVSLETGRLRGKDGKPETSCICVAVGEKDSLLAQERAKGFKLRAQEEIIFRALWAARERRGVVAPADLVEAAAIKPTTVVITYQEWRDAYEAMAAPDADGEKPTKEAISKMFRRHSSGMAKYEVIGMHNHENTPYLWWTGKPIRGFPATNPDYVPTNRGQQPDGFESEKKMKEAIDNGEWTPSF